MVFWCCGVRMMEGRMWSMMALLPFVGMVLAILAQVSTMEITKGALSQGLNKYVIIVYSNAISTLLLLPCSFIFHRLDRTPVTFSLLTNFFLLSVFGCSAQIFGNGGIQYSSPMLGTAFRKTQGIIGLTFRISMMGWCVGKIGPVYVAMLKPMGILFAVIMDAIFLGEALTLGSLIGAFIIVAGFYAVVWGKAKEEKTTEASEVGSSESSGNEAPLLRNSIEEI